MSNSKIDSAVQKVMGLADDYAHDYSFLDSENTMGRRRKALEDALRGLLATPEAHTAEVIVRAIERATLAAKVSGATAPSVQAALGAATKAREAEEEVIALVRTAMRSPAKCQ